MDTKLGRLFFTKSETPDRIAVNVDADAAYVESSAGRSLTANTLREIADDLDSLEGGE